MAPPVKKKTTDQNELRRIMKERREKIKSEDKKIDSPLAKYDNAGNLSCAVCNVPIKKESLWSSHIVGKVHRQNLEILKKKRNAISNSKPDGNVHTTKRKGEEITLPNAQRPHKDDPSQSSPKQLKKNEESSRRPTLHFDYQDDIAEEEANQNGTESAQDANNQLASDSSEKSTSAAQKSANPAEALPQGFFDDPKMDAKIRKVEYKDPMDEEWDLFQKAITEENTASQAIIEEEIEESKVEREIDEIDEQIQNWARVQALQKKKEEILHKEQNSEDISDNSTLDEQEYEDLLDWRAKGVWKQSC